MSQRAFVIVLSAIRIPGSEVDQIERLINNLLRQMQLSNVLHAGGPFALRAPVFRRAHNGDARMEFVVPDFPPPNDASCIEPLPDRPSVLVRGCETLLAI